MHQRKNLEVWNSYKPQIQLLESFKVVNIYIHPDINVSKENLEELIPTNKYFLILKDLNSKHSAWNNELGNHRGRIT